MGLHERTTHYLGLWGLQRGIMGCLRLFESSGGGYLKLLRLSVDTDSYQRAQNSYLRPRELSEDPEGCLKALGVIQGQWGLSEGMGVTRHETVERTTWSIPLKLFRPCLLQSIALP